MSVAVPPGARSSRRPLRVRLVVIVAALVLGAVATLAVVSVIVLRQYLLIQAENVLSLSRDSFSSQLDQLIRDDETLPDLDENYGLVPPSDGFYIVADSSGAASLYLGPDFSLTELDTATVGTVLDTVSADDDADYSTQRVTISGLGDFLVTSFVSGVDASGGATVAFAGVGLAEIDSTIMTFVCWEIGIGLVAAAVVVLVGYRIIRTALTPLEYVVDVADKFAQTPLSSGEVAVQDRVPVIGSQSEDEATRVALAVNRLLSHVELSLNVRHQTEESMRRFIAEASHELKNPLAAIRGYADVYSGVPGIDAETSEAFGRIGAESQRMNALVEQLLLLARLDAGPALVHEEVDLCRIVLESVADARIAHPGHRWSMRLPDEPVEVLGDEGALRQILLNLIANASHHTPPGTAVVVTVDRGTVGARLIVHDTGPGIPADALSTIFDRFTQASAGTGNTREASNVGLGLAIVHALATELGVGISVASAPGDTSFTVSFPSAALVAAG